MGKYSTLPEKTITHKQLVAWKWWPRTGHMVFFGRDGRKHIYADRIMVFLGAAGDSSRIATKDAKVAKMLKEYSHDGFIYFAIGRKQYRVPLKENEHGKA